MENGNREPNILQELEQLNVKLMVDQLDSEIELETQMGSASEQMEIDEIHSKLKHYSVAYRAGFNEGFSAGRRLMQKHDMMKAESIHKKYLELKARLGLGLHHNSGGFSG